MGGYTTYLPAYLPTCLHYLPTFLQPNRPTYPPTYLPTRPEALRQTQRSRAPDPSNLAVALRPWATRRTPHARPTHMPSDALHRHAPTALHHSAAQIAERGAGTRASLAKRTCAHKCHSNDRTATHNACSCTRCRRMRRPLGVTCAIWLFTHLAMNNQTAHVTRRAAACRTATATLELRCWVGGWGYLRAT